MEITIVISIERFSAVGHFVIYICDNTNPKYHVLKLFIKCSFIVHVVTTEVTRMERCGFKTQKGEKAIHVACIILLL